VIKKPPSSPSSSSFQAKEGSSFLLEGGAGVGKTFLLGELLKRVHSNAFTRDVVCVAAPTHKAINVLRRKLDAFGVQWCLGFDDYTYNGEDVITGTTAALLGIRPVITDDQTAEVKFGKTHRGILSKCMPKVLLIDEVSMLGKVDFLDLRNTLKNAGSKLIVIGDRGQLPPVKQEAVPFDLFQNKAQLREIVRQAADSAIVTLAWAIRDGKDWHAIEGKGVTRVEYLAESFIEQLGEASVLRTVAGKGMQWLREEDRPVFIAYTNKR
jgi:exodeoxyribonuclease-5